MKTTILVCLLLLKAFIFGIKRHGSLNSSFVNDLADALD